MYDYAVVILCHWNGLWPQSGIDCVDVHLGGSVEFHGVIFGLVGFFLRFESLEKARKCLSRKMSAY